MRQRAVAQRPHRICGDGTAVTGHGARGKGARLTVHPCQHRLRQIAAQPVDRQGARGRFVQQKDGRAGIAHRAQPVEIGHAAKVKAARLDRTLRRGQAGGQDDDLPRHRVKPGLIALQGHAHAVGRAVGRDFAQDDAVQRQAQRVRLRPVDADDPPFDRAVIAKLQHRRGQRMRADARSQPARRQRRHDHGQGAREVGRAPGQRQPRGQRQRRHGIACRPRFLRQAEPHRNADADQHGQPGKQRAARCLHLLQRPQDQARRHHLATPPAIA